MHTAERHHELHSTVRGAADWYQSTPLLGVCNTPTENGFLMAATDLFPFGFTCRQHSCESKGKTKIAQNVEKTLCFWMDGWTHTHTQFSRLHNAGYVKH